MFKTFVSLLSGHDLFIYIYITYIIHIYVHTALSVYFKFFTQSLIKV